MEKTGKTILWVVILIIVISLGWWGMSKRSVQTGEEPIKIGAILPLTGKIAKYAEEAMRGIEMATEEESDLNLKIIYEDSKSDAKEGISAYYRIKTGNVLLIITGASPISIAISSLANQDEVLQMAVFSSVSSYSSPNDFTFRVTTRSEVEDEKIASWAIEQGYKKVALLYTNSDWGLSHYEFIKSEFEKLGGEIIIEESFLKTDNDFRTQLIKIKEEKPEAIFLLARSQNAGMILRQAKELGLETQFFGVRAVESSELLEIAGDAAHGLIYPYSFNSLSDKPRVSVFVNKYQAKYNEIPTAYVAEGYDATNLLIKAIKQCGGVDTECIKTDLLNTKDYPGILGDMTFDQYGDMYYSFFIKIVKDGQFVPYGGE